MHSRSTLRIETTMTIEEGNRHNPKSHGQTLGLGESTTNTKSTLKKCT
jgi:hypothetical protein